MEQQEAWNEERAQRHAMWAKMSSRVIYAPFARKIVVWVGPLEEGATAVDLGAGPGVLSLELGKLWPRARIIGVDLSADMLMIARKNATAAGVSNFQTRLGRAEEIPLESNSVNLVVSQSSFHEWDDQKKGLSEVLRVLQPGGRLILKDYNRAWLSGWKRRLLGLLHHLDMFRFTFEEAATLLREAGFAEIKGQKQGVQFLAGGRKQ
jgi:ubiquinone/menaquinone biosynthesis C-methylase UbiE